jgi:hypothetical protein
MAEESLLIPLLLVIAVLPHKMLFRILGKEEESSLEIPPPLSVATFPEMVTAVKTGDDLRL